MKITCDFCKTEYSVSKRPNGAVKCAICGNTWVPPNANRRGPFMVFFAALCALLSAIVFTVAVITRHQMDAKNPQTLVATATAVHAKTDAETGTTRLVVDGVVANYSDEIYGVPDLIIIAYDADDNVIARQKFMPSATLLDAGTRVNFSHTVSVPATGVKRVSVELSNMGDKK